MKRISFLESSSTKLAFIFSAILLLAAILLGMEIVALRGPAQEPITISMLVLILLILVGSCLFFISFYVTKRINTIVCTADQIIATSDLSQRIPLDSRWDDLSKLSFTLNGMLAQIEQLVLGIRTLSDNIAHDLRHPLTRLRNHIDTMRHDHRDNPALQENFRQLIGECDALLSTFQALLRISNIESGKRHSGFYTIDMVQLLDDVVELYEPLAAEKSIHLTYEYTPAQTMGDKDLLFQAFANLLDNAIKYTPEHGTIRMNMAPHLGGARVVICDSGMGISDEDKRKVFRRFYRVEHSRRAPGSGLGLSLVSAIITLHNGQVGLADNPAGGLVVTVTL